MADLKHFTPRPLPGNIDLTGDYVSVRRLDWARHGSDLFREVSGPENADIWTYLAFYPHDTAEHFQQEVSDMATLRHWKSMAICAPKNGKALGMASFMRLRPEVGSCEVGCVVFGKKLQQSRAATQAMYLMARHVFEDLGYRRYEWKCDNNNEASKRAAIRFGFQYEGLFRNDNVVKGRNRDTAWYSITQEEWPAVKSGFERWLDPNNFGSGGRQKQPLAKLRNET